MVISTFSFDPNLPPNPQNLHRGEASGLPELVSGMTQASVRLQNYWCLDIGRVLIGCGIGILSYVVPVYISHITPKNLRGGFATVNQVMICCGGSLAFVLGTFIAWRTLAIVGVAPCLLQLVGLLLIPESPIWLARFGHPGAFVVALQTLRGHGTDISEEASEIKVFTEKLQRLPKSKMLDLFQKDCIRAVTAGVGLMALQQLGGVNGILFYASEVFVSAGFSSGNTGTIAMAVVQVPMVGLGVLLMDKAGRRPLLMISAAGTCLGCLLVGFSFLSKHWERDLNVLALAGLLVFIGSFSLGMGGIPWVIMSEIFPINMKGSAGSLVTLVSWLGSWVVSYAFNFLLIWSPMNF
ncbi:sugar transporter ERD6-like 5 [Miscanthus floridulus]|uniref:sugar transporter ERD6-like 5 n=1 Tax=Miscanthus floridulus TaxID=154761 RepID=UPI0034586777